MARARPSNAKRRGRRNGAPLGRRADGTIKPGFYLDCAGKMRTAGKAALRAHKRMARSLARGTKRRRRPAAPRRPRQLALL